MHIHTKRPGPAWARLSVLAALGSTLCVPADARRSGLTARRLCKQISVLMPVSRKGPPRGPTNCKAWGPDLGLNPVCNKSFLIASLTRHLQFLPSPCVLQGLLPGFACWLACPRSRIHINSRSKLLHRPLHVSSLPQGMSSTVQRGKGSWLHDCHNLKRCYCSIPILPSVRVHSLEYCRLELVLELGICIVQSRSGSGSGLGSVSGSGSGLGSGSGIRDSHSANNAQH